MINGRERERDKERGSERGKERERRLRERKECQAGTQRRWQAQSCWTERRLGTIRRQDKSEDRDEGKSKAHETQSRELESLSALNPAELRRMPRSVASRDLPGQRNRREIVLEARSPGQWRRTRKAGHNKVKSLHATVLELSELRPWPD